MRPSVPRLCGVLSIALGAELIVGWLLQSEAMVKIVATSNSVSFNTAIAFVLCGVALLLPPHGQGLRWLRGLAAVVAVGATAILVENLFDVALGLDWVSLHRVVQDGSPRPGRVAPNTCLALMLLSAMLLTRGRTPRLVRRRLMAVCGILMLLLLTSGVAGVMLDPTLMFGWYRFNRMAAPTAFGLGLLLVGVYAEHRAVANQGPRSAQQQQQDILLTGTLILLGMGLAGAITTSVIFANRQQQTIREKLQSELDRETELAGVVIAQSAAEAGGLNARPLLKALIERVADHRAPADVVLLQTTLGRLLEQGFARLHLQWVDGAPAIAVGGVNDPVELALPLRAPAGSELLWRRQGFFFRTVIEVASPSSGQIIGRLTTERPLPALSSLHAPSDAKAGSAEAVICGRLDQGVACFPSRLQPQPMLLPPVGQRARSPLDDALAGQSGVRNVQDYRGVNVVMAYSQLGNTGMVVLSKVDATEIYQPIGHLLSRAMMVLCISLAIGVLLLRRTVGPLVDGITRSEARAVESERRLKLMTDNVPALIGSLDRDLKYTFMNATYERWFGRPVAEMLGRSPRELLGDDYVGWRSLVGKALKGETVQFTYQPPFPRPGQPQFVAVSYLPDVGADGRVLSVSVLALDVTEQHRQEDALAHQAHHDSLTGLPNRRLFDDRLAQALNRSKRRRELMALLYLDVDHFKQINDTLGHSLGDQLLAELAQRLSRAVRATDTVARLGGDEFVVLMEGLAGKQDALVVVNKILAAVRPPVALGGSPRKVTVSMGLSYANGDDTDAEQLVKRSDAALYQAKAAGRDGYAVFVDELASTH